MTAKVGISQAEQQRLNRSIVIELLRQKRVCSRADLAKESGLKRPTITNIINEFIDSGLVVEDGLRAGDKGRRSIGIRVNGERFRMIGVMVRRNDFAVGMMGISGEMYSTEYYPIPEATEAEKLITKIKREIRHLLNNVPKDARVLAIGIALPGPYRGKMGETLFVTNLDGWNSMPAFRQLQEGFDIPVFVENDANAGAYAQYWCAGDDHPQRDLAYVVAGQGVGCGFISGGDVFRGSFGTAGEIGHTTIHFEGPPCECGNRGCLETYCSLIALYRRMDERIQAGEKTILETGFTNNEFHRAILAGDEVACEEYTKACSYLAIGVVNLINQINPGRLIIGDELVALAPEILLDTIQKKVEASIHPLVLEELSIETDRLPHNPVLIGAGAIAAKNVFMNPLAYVK